jgi:uncharacterized protein (DUF305 family)
LRQGVPQILPNAQGIGDTLPQSTEKDIHRMRAWLRENFHQPSQNPATPTVHMPSRNIDAATCEKVSNQ